MNSEQIKYAMENRQSIEPEGVTREMLREAGCDDRVCVLPEKYNDRVSYLGDVLVQITCKGPKDDRLRSTVGKLTQALSYLINSTSWQEGELFDFDQMELQRKLEPLLNARCG